MEEMEYIVIDGKEYNIIKELETEGRKYVLLANNDDVNDVFVRRVTHDEDTDYIVGLASPEEFEKVMVLFMKELR